MTAHRDQVRQIENDVIIAIRDALTRIDAMKRPSTSLRIARLDLRSAQEVLEAAGASSAVAPAVPDDGTASTDSR